MESREAGLNDLGTRIEAALVEATRPEEQIRSARSALLDRVAAGTRPRERWSFGGRRGRAAGFALVGMAGTAAAAFWFYSRQPLSFEVGGTGVEAGLSVPILAERGESVPLTFSEGSSVVLHAGGRVRVLGTKSDGAHVLLESGSIDVAITHRQRNESSWTFDAGPLSVAITGTKFRLGWTPRDQVFALVVSEGSVSVSGSCLPASRSLRAGEQLRLTCGVSAPVLPPPSAAAAPADAAAAPAPAESAPPAPAPAAAAGAIVESTWRDHLRRGELGAALAAAERADFEAVCRSAEQSELLALADAARLRGDFDKASVALGALRRRFPRSANAAAAAFSLGRIAFERRGAYADAVRWFSTYLEEAPNGPLMGDAVGRLMEARQRQGDLEGARTDAERYLQRFPKGPYAGLAKRLLSRQ